LWLWVKASREPHNGDGGTARSTPDVRTARWAPIPPRAPLLHPLLLPLQPTGAAQPRRRAHPVRATPEPACCNRPADMHPQWCPIAAAAGGAAAAAAARAPRPARRSRRPRPTALLRTR
jgi:hypothetical protein